MGIQFVKKSFQNKEGEWIADSWEDFGSFTTGEERFFQTKEEADAYLAQIKAERNAYDFETFKGRVPVTDGSERERDVDGKFKILPNTKTQIEFEAL